MADALVEAQQLVDFVVGLDLERVPTEVREEARRSFLDSVGCIVGGSRHPVVGQLIATLAPTFGPRGASLLGQGAQADVLNAPFVNGLAGASYSYFDSYSSAHLHSGVVHTAALLAIAETTPATGPDFLAAYIAGMEAACRLTKAIALPPASADIGWSIGGIVCGISAALASGRLLGLNSQQLLHAAGIAASGSAGTRAQQGSMTAALLFGQAAQIGVRAAVLARDGFTSSTASIDGQWGFTTMFAKVPNNSALTDGLGTEWELLATTYKPFPTDIAVHPSVDAMLRLHREHRVDGHEIAAIELDVSDLAATFCDRPTPADELEAKFSVQHWVASAAHFGTAGLPQGSRAAIDDSEIKRLCAAMTLTMDPQLAFDSGVVTVELVDGRRLTTRVEHCVGSASSPMSDDELTHKFTEQASLAIGPDRAGLLAAMCWDINTLPEVASIATVAC